MIIYEKRNRGEELLDRMYIAGVSFVLGMFAMLGLVVFFMRGLD